jgi:hypothetical protein
MLYLSLVIVLLNELSNLPAWQFKTTPIKRILQFGQVDKPISILVNLEQTTKIT